MNDSSEAIAHQPAVAKRKLFRNLSQYFPMENSEYGELRHKKCHGHPLRRNLNATIPPVSD